jgi:hypothetical protein
VRVEKLPWTARGGPLGIFGKKYSGHPYYRVEVGGLGQRPGGVHPHPLGRAPPQRGAAAAHEPRKHSAIRVLNPSIQIGESFACELVNRGTADEPILEREFYPYQPDEMTLRALLSGKTPHPRGGEPLEEGGVLRRVPKA